MMVVVVVVTATSQEPPPLPDELSADLSSRPESGAFSERVDDLRKKPVIVLQPRTDDSSLERCKLLLAWVRLCLLWRAVQARMGFCTS